jgi:hypothetical protein
MEFLAVLFLAIGIAIIVGAYYFLLAISIAIWLPSKAKPQWLSMVQSPGIRVSYSFFKWIAPGWLILSAIYLILLVIKLILVGEI